MRRHPANKIMQLHYHPLRESHGTYAVPSILGLTASPIVRSNKEELQAIETNLNAVCRTPRVNRTELLECVHRPHLKRLSYSPTELDDKTPNSRLLLPLRRCIQEYDIQDDPYIELMRQDPDKLAEAHEFVVSGKTFCKEQLVKFLERSVHMYEELGGWATDFFIKASIEQFQNSIENDKDLTGINRQERVHLLDLLMSMSVPEAEPESFHISPKLATLFEYLEQMDQPEFSGIIFAQRRAVVGVLARLISLHPTTKGRFQSAPYVGWSSSQNGDCLGDLVSKDMQRDTLSEFRAGRKNLIVATDVLEKGLDISPCSLVICFDKPANLKSFVQRRGRARRQVSTYTIMASTEDDKINVTKWQELEKVMVETYLDDRRRQTEMESLERYDETVERRLFVPSTRYCYLPHTSVLSPSYLISSLVLVCLPMNLCNTCTTSALFYRTQTIATIDRYSHSKKTAPDLFEQPSFSLPLFTPLSAEPKARTGGTPNMPRQKKHLFTHTKPSGNTAS